MDIETNVCVGMTHYKRGEGPLQFTMYLGKAEVDKTGEELEIVMTLDALSYELRRVNTTNSRIVVNLEPVIRQAIGELLKGDGDGWEPGGG